MSVTFNDFFPESSLYSNDKNFFTSPGYKAHLIKQANEFYGTTFGPHNPFITVTVDVSSELSEDLLRAIHFPYGPSLIYVTDNTGKIVSFDNFEKEECSINIFQVAHGQQSEIRGEKILDYHGEYPRPKIIKKSPKYNEAVMSEYSIFHSYLSRHKSELDDKYCYDHADEIITKALDEEKIRNNACIKFCQSDEFRNFVFNECEKHGISLNVHNENIKFSEEFDHKVCVDLGLADSGAELIYMEKPGRSSLLEKPKMEIIPFTGIDDLISNPGATVHKIMTERGVDLAAKVPRLKSALHKDHINLLFKETEESKQNKHIANYTFLRTCKNATSLAMSNPTIAPKYILEEAIREANEYDRDAEIYRKTGKLPESVEDHSDHDNESEEEMELD